jgi:glutamate synthase (NADPH/NADH) large chain
MLVRAGRGRRGGFARFRRAILDFADGSIAGNGLAAFNVARIEMIVRGGAQDGVAKSAAGGRVVVLKGVNHDGRLVDGSVGKCFAYGAQAGLLIVHGDADSRAAIRLSGADVIFGGRLRAPLRDDLGNLASRANLKGFAFEYMTSGRGLVLGDPGPWLCSGMTGGVVYLLTDDEMGLTRDAIQRRLAAGARVAVASVPEGESGLVELLGEYARALREAELFADADEIERLLEVAYTRFVKVVPARAPRALPLAPEAVESLEEVGR